MNRKTLELNTFTSQTAQIRKADRDNDQPKLDALYRARLQTAVAALEIGISPAELSAISGLGRY